MSKRYTNTYNSKVFTRTPSYNNSNCSLFCLFLILIFAIFVMGLGFSNNQKIILLNLSPQNSHLSPYSSQSTPPALPTTIPTRCWGNSCNGIGINPDIRNTRDIFNDPYIPPVKNNNCSYKQMGILTSDNLILPLIGKPHINGRDKWNYYAISNTGSINTKLPIRVHGKVCTNEYGCDEIFSGDIVHIEGYNRNFQTTIYENNSFTYDPII